LAQLIIVTPCGCTELSDLIALTHAGRIETSKRGAGADPGICSGDSVERWQRG